MSKTIAILAVPGVQLLDVSGPMDAFAEANIQAKCDYYRLQVIGCNRQTITTSSGIKLVPDWAIGQRLPPELDTLLVAGAPGITQYAGHQPTLSWLRKIVPQTRRYGSVCSGAFLLAAAGLLDGHQVTTHWAVAEQLAATYPAVSVDKDAIYVRDGALMTAAGVTAGLDLALVMIEDDLGRTVAQQVAAQLVMFFKRPGGQMQFSYNDQISVVGRSALQEVQRWVIENISQPHTVNSLAQRLGITPRHFGRLFNHEVGSTPAKWIESVRIAEARRLLESGELPPKKVADAAGYSSVELLRRAFIRQLGVSPADYRKIYRAGQQLT